MGWTFQRTTKDALVKELTQTQRGTTTDGQPYEFKTLRHSLRGNRLWTVQQGRGPAFICLYLLENDQNDPSYWGYKDISEDMGPYEVDCPITFLSLVGEPVNAYSKEWREKVREFHAEKKKTKALKASFQEGDRIRTAIPIQFTDGNTHQEFTVVKYGKKTYFKARGLLYRIHDKALRDATKA